MATNRKSNWQETMRRDTENLSDWYASPRGMAVLVACGALMLYVLVTNLF